MTIMKLDRTLSLIAGLALAMTTLAQQPRIVVQGSGDPHVFTSLADAIAGAQANDVVYCSGGTFAFTGGLVINKPLHFIGAGFHPDSTLATSATVFFRQGNTEPLRISQAASGSTFTGIDFSSSTNAFNHWLIAYGTDADDDLTTDILFHRCRFGTGSVRLGSNTAQDAPLHPELITTFDECQIHAGVNGMGRSAVVTRCILDAKGTNVYALGGFNGASLTVQNCVFLGAMMNTCAGSQVSNCIFTGNGGQYDKLCMDCAGGTISNTLKGFADLAYYNPQPATVNVLQVDPATLFVSETDHNYQFTDDLHMAAGSPGTGFGTDGNDVGIYGSTSPYKPGGVPFNPHFRQADIAPATNSSGALPVNLKVAAQQQ